MHNSVGRTSRDSRPPLQQHTHVCTTSNPDQHYTQSRARGHPGTTRQAKTKSKIIAFLVHTCFRQKLHRNSLDPRCQFDRSVEWVPRLFRHGLCRAALAKVVFEVVRYLTTHPTRTRGRAEIGRENFSDSSGKKLHGGRVPAEKHAHIHGSPSSVRVPASVRKQP